MIQSARLHEVEPFAYVSDLLTRLTKYRDMTPERRATDGERLLRELLPDAWVKSNPEKRLALAR